jgi:hypothetical protein
VKLTGAASRRSEVGPETSDPWAMPGEFLRVSVGYGAGLIRAYELVSPGLGRSSVSHQLDPLAHYAGRIDLRVPGGVFGMALSGSFRPVSYQVDAGAEGSSAPGGSLTEAGGAALWHLSLGRGTRALTLIPQLGARLALGSVEPHPGNAVLSTTAFALTGGLAVRGRPVANLELQAGLDGGILLSYTESPRTSGGSPRGFTAGGDLGARLWLTRSLALGLDVRFGMDRVAFVDEPTRRLPPIEEGRLSDLELTVTELRSSVGATFRM